MAKQKETQITVLKSKQEIASVESFITKAIETSLPVETMERLFALRKEVKAEVAKEAFDVAMANFQGDCPVIKKSKNGGKTDSGVVAYKYAPLDAIVSQTKKLIKDNGFSYAIQTSTIEGGVKVTCQVKHELGHSESSSVEVPLGTKTKVMSDPQVVASALTFAKRYAFCNAFGILTGDEDTDAEKTDEESTVDMFETAKKKIQACKNQSVLEEYDKKIASSKKYTVDQKKELKSLINAQADKI